MYLVLRSSSCSGASCFSSPEDHLLLRRSPKCRWNLSYTVLRTFSCAFLTTASMKSAAWCSLIPSAKTVTQSANHGLALEARETRPEHELCGRDELRRIRAQQEEGSDAELLEERVALRVS